MRTNTITQEEYDDALDSIIDEFQQSLLDVLEDGHADFDMYEEQYILFDYLGDAWFEPPLKNATYDSLTKCVVVDELHAVSENVTQDVAWQDGPNAVIDDLTYQYIKQELYELVEQHVAEYTVVMQIHHTLHTLSQQTPPDDLHDAFAKWFFHQRNGTSTTPAGNVPAIDDNEFTPNHITLQDFIDPTTTALVIALHHWLLEAHPYTYNANDYEPDFLNPTD